MGLIMLRIVLHWGCLGSFSMCAVLRQGGLAPCHTSHSLKNGANVKIQAITVLLYSDRVKIRCVIFKKSMFLWNVLVFYMIDCYHTHTMFR